MRFLFLPREEKFFTLFDEFAAVMTRASRKFFEMVSVFDKLHERGEDLRKEEHSADLIVERIIQALDRTFITPLDREDIHNLATSLDDVLDNMEETAYRLEAFRIGRPTEAAVRMAGIINDCCVRLEKALHLLKNLKHVEEINGHLREISRLENEADRIYRDSDSALFANPPDVLELIKWRELYGWLEESVDACKDVSMIISEIVIKGS